MSDYEPEPTHTTVLTVRDLIRVLQDRCEPDWHVAVDCGTSLDYAPCVQWDEKEMRVEIG